MTSAVAEVTSVRTWEDMVLAAHLTARRVAQVRTYIAGLTDRDSEPEPTDADAALDAAIEADDAAERDREDLDRLDYETDGDLDGDHMIRPEDSDTEQNRGPDTEPDTEPDLEPS